MRVLLVEPKYYTQFPPLGLLKISSYYKNLGHETFLVKGEVLPPFVPDKVFVTSLFTWAWKPVWDSIKYYKGLFPNAEVVLGGLYASLLPDHARESGATVYEGLFHDAEDLMPDYTLLENSGYKFWREWDGSIIFASRGCIFDCPYCVVPKLEGRINSMKRSIKHLVYPKYKRIIFFDNNILASKYWREIFNELIELKKYVDFNQGIDARLITDEVASYLSKMKVEKMIRLAYDDISRREYVRTAIEILKAHGIGGRRIMVYTLFNFNDSPEDFFERVRDIINWGAVAYPMQYQPLDALEKNSYISPKWTKEEIEMVQSARRVIGYGGAFPPHEGIKIKFNKAKTFKEAFTLNPKSEKIVHAKLYKK
ncbi:MAG: hypothetical protein QXE78_09525 [Nitrososphaeria archaeon]